MEDIKILIDKLNKLRQQERNLNKRYKKENNSIFINRFNIIEVYRQITNYFIEHDGQCKNCGWNCLPGELILVYDKLKFYENNGQLNKKDLYLLCPNCNVIKEKKDILITVKLK